MKKIIFTRPEDGGVSLGYPTPKEVMETWTGPLTEEEYVALIWKTVPENAINPMYVEDEDLKDLDMKFRDAWKQVSNKIDYDLEKAREIQLKKIRKARDPKLKELDKQFMIAVEKKQSLLELTNAKKRLRDATEPLKNAELKSLDDVKNLWPVEILGEQK